MRIRFWSSVEGTAFMQRLMRELTDAGFEARQCFQISEASYRSAKSGTARLFLRFRQYIVYPAQLGVALLGKRVRVFSSRHKLEAGIQTTINDQRSTTNDSVAVVSTNTFYAPLLATYLHPKVVHLVYDLFPEAMIHSGKWTEGTLKVRLVRWITKQTLKRAKQNVFLGQRLQDYVESIHGPLRNAAIIAVGADQSLFPASPTKRDSAKMVRRKACLEGVTETGALGAEQEQTLGSEESDHPDLASKSGLLDQEGGSDGATSSSNCKLESSPTILYCGNFGNMHDSATLFEYWRQTASAMADGELLMANREIAPDQSASNQQQTTSHKIAWRFHCSGPKRAALELVRDALPHGLKGQIQLGGGLDQAEWIATMESADVALVTMVPGSETVVMPSKTYSAMMAGQAILAIAPENSDLVDLIKAADCGWFVEPGDVAGLAKVVEAISADAAGVLEKREHAYQYAQAHLGQDALAKDWMRVLRDTATPN